MPSRARPPRPAMYNTPTIRNGGFGALQVEAINNRPLSIARRHFAASQLRMRDIEPDELSSSEWVRFLVMEERERERWMTDFWRRRRNSDESTASSSSAGPSNAGEGEGGPTEKAEEARLEAEEAAAANAVPTPPSSSPPPTSGRGVTPSVSLWARRFDEESNESGSIYSARRPRHMRRVVTDGIIEAPPTYDVAVRARTPPPAYEPRSDDDEEQDPSSPPMSPRRVRFAV